MSDEATMSQEALAGLIERIPSVRPWDENNRRWVGYVRPPDWSNPTPSGTYNLLVVGAGPAGLVAAVGAAGLGAKVALVEKHLLGGDCLNVGCVPSKSLIDAGKAAAAIAKAAEFGVHVDPAARRIDFKGAMDRLRRVRAGLSKHDSAERLSGLGIDVFLGEGRFTGPQSFEIDGKTIAFSRACIATGARAAAPSIPGLDGVDYLTNETVFSLTELQRRLAVIGAGPIGCEMSQAFARLGSRVHLFESMHGILPREDRDAAEIVAAAIAADGVVIRCCSRDLKVSRADGGKRITVESHGVHVDEVFDEILVAVGRAPNVEGLGLEAAGVSYDEKGIQVDDRLRTSNPRIFAAGDVASRFQFTHSADALARIVLRNALFMGRGKASALVIPWATYTNPELAHVGKTAAELEKEGVPHQTITVNMAEVDRAAIDAENDGFVRVHADRKGRILGATVVAAHAGDLMGEISLAMTNGLTLGQIASTIHPYPTQAEAIKKAGDAFNRTRLTPFVKRLFAWWLEKARR
jgi:pyruvate/2-oxoglutarate dehydrogenase complex dihydrolipoamide dehydrogenase (E3) component